MPTVAVVGANLAGGRAVETLRALGFDGRIVLIGDEPHRPYERPPLSKEVLRGDWQPEKTFLRPLEWYAENDVELMLGVRATMLEPQERVVMAGGSLVPFDLVLLCTGGRPRTLPVPGADLPGVQALRTLDDATAIGDAMRAGARVVIVGGGFIGCEVAASARALGCEVSLVEPLSVPLARALGERIGGALARIHADEGVALHLGASVVAIEGAGRAERVMLGDGRRLDADLVVAGVGIEPNDELAREAGIWCGNGIVVDEHCRTSIPWVYAAGDVAEHPNPFAGGMVRLEHWQNAQIQGAAAARAMLDVDEPYAEVPWFWSDQYDVNLQMAGHPSRWDRLVVRGDEASRSFSAFYLDGEKLVGAVGVNRSKDVRGARALMERSATVDDATLADESADLRRLAKD